MNNVACYGPTGNCQRTAPCKNACDLRIFHCTDLTGDVQAVEAVIGRHPVMYTRAALDAAVAAERDCRTCRHFRGQCDSVVKCMDGSGYQRGGAVRLWEG